MDGADRMGIEVGPKEADQLAVHAEALMLWAEKTNLTTIRDPLEVAVKHYLDSLAPVALIPRNAQLLDVGSGGGFPGIPLKIMIPSLSVILMDASRKKVSFLKHIIRTLALESIDAIQGRVEMFATQMRFDVIVSRAFSDLNSFIRMAAPLLAKDGVLMAFKTEDASSEIASLKDQNLKKKPSKPCSADPFAFEVYPYRIPFLERKRSIVIIRRHKENPSHAR